MGEAKRRQENLGEDYGKEKPDYLLPFLPVTKKQSEKFIKLSTKGAWVGIVGLVAGWVVIRFIGPSLGWWQLLDTP